MIHSLADARGIKPVLEEFLDEADEFRSVVVLAITTSGDAKVGKVLNNLTDVAYANALLQAYTTEYILGSEEE